MNSKLTSEIPVPYLFPLPLEFYERSTDDVARDLLGKILVKKLNDKIGDLGCKKPDGEMINISEDAFMAGRIVEVEAYFGPGDPASHACNGPTPRSSIMFGRAGKAYVYINYGVHYLLNIVTETEGKAGAVLLRAIEPVEGLHHMRENRTVKRDVDVSNGPGKLTKALGIEKEHNGLDMTKSENGLYVTDDTNPNIANMESMIAVSERIGITDGKEMLLRFSIKDNPYVSR